MLVSAHGSQCVQLRELMDIELVIYSASRAIESMGVIRNSAFGGNVY